MRIARVEKGFQPTADGKAASSERGMVTSVFPDATRAGVEMLEQGGNAIDAATATGLALGVCEPQASGLGGQSTGLVHVNGRTFALDGSSRVPSLAHRERIAEAGKAATALGYGAATVPSSIATYGWLHEHYGVLPWHAVVEPSIRIARDGYCITDLQSSLQRRELDRFASVPSNSGGRYFLKDGAAPYEPGDRFVQTELATTLEVIARDGPESFYKGPIAQQIDADMKANGGFLRADDLALTPWPIEREPLRRRYRGYLIASMPPPGSGRTVLFALMALNHLKSSFLSGRDPSRYHFIAETLRKALFTSLDRPFDPNTYPQIRNKHMLSRRVTKELALSVAEAIDGDLPIQDVSEDAGETTHFTVMDGAANVVSMTQSIELVFGSKAAADGLGFLYNNYMGALELNDPEHPYYLRPNAVPWSSAAPTIVFRKREPWLALGSPGSERIMSVLSQFLVNVIDGSATITEAMAEPRLHCSIGGRISLEEDRFDRAVVKHLRELGYRIDKRDSFDFYLGCVQAVLRCQTSAGFQGVADLRRDGSALGPA